MDPCTLRTIRKISVILTVMLCLVTQIGHAQAHHGKQWEIASRAILDALLQEEDTDGDHTITVHDPYIPGTSRGDKAFWFTDVSGQPHQIAGTTRLAYLLEELTLMVESHQERGWLPCDHIDELPVAHIARSIRERFWDGLTRRIDEGGLQAMVHDVKMRSDSGTGQYLYVPATDTMAHRYFQGIAARHPSWALHVIPIPAPRDRTADRSIHTPPGLLTLALTVGQHRDTSGVPFVVPGGRFNEMYGWDSHFIILGLLHDGRVALAQDMVENHVYEIEHYGAVLNANRTYYLTRSQPPFLTSSALACYARMPAGHARDVWMRRVITAAIREYHDVWMNSDHLLPIGLSRYHDSGTGVPPEVEPGHFDAIFRQAGRRLGMTAAECEDRYRSGQLRDAQLDTYFGHDRAMRESGHDTSNRLVNRCHDLATVDLNALLYKTEIDIAMVIQTVFHGTMKRLDGATERSADWTARARHRQQLVDEYLWDAPRGMYMDYDTRAKARTGFESATTFWPLWAGCASREQARAVVTHALPRLEQPGGLAGSSLQSRGEVSADRPQRQWDYPYGWAPHQMIAWDALRRSGYLADARRLAYKWLLTIVSNACDYNGTIPEKFDVVRCTHEVFAEYGNVGTQFEYLTREGFGWTNASFQAGSALLSPSLRASLNARRPASCIDFHIDQ